MKRIAVIAALFLLAPSAWAQTTPSILGLIAQYESSDNPTAQNPTSGSTASGLYGDINSTWAEALAACNCGSVSEYPSAYLAPSSVQTAAEVALLQQNGLSDYICADCDVPLTNAINAAGGPSAFASQIASLSTNPADYASLDTSAGLTAYFDVGAATTTAATGGEDQIVGQGNGLTVTLAQSPTSSGQTQVNNLPGTSTLTNGALDQIASQFQTQTAGWQASLLQIATDLFWILAVIDLAAALILLVMNGERDLGSVIATIIHWIFPVFLFWWSLQNGSTYAGDIVNSLRQAGTAIGGVAITPSTVFWAGLNIVTTIVNNHHGFLGAIADIPVILLAIPIIISFALAAVWMLMALVESYFKIGLAALFMSFGGMRWTRDIAVSLLRSCLAVGFKLLAMEAITNLGVGIVKQWATQAAGLSFWGLFIMLGSGVAFAALVKMVPDSVERTVLGGGMSLAHWGQFTRQATANAAEIAAPAVGLAGVGALAVQLIRHALESEIQSRQGGQFSPTSTARLLALAGTMGATVSRAAGAEIGGRIGGLYRGGISASAIRMANQVAQQRRIQAAQAARPQAPGTNNPQHGGP